MKATYTPPHIQLARAAVCLLAALPILLAGCIENDDDSPIIVVSDGKGTEAGPKSREEIIRIAKEYNELVWYTSAPEKAAKEFLAAFKQEYPFIVPRLERSNTFDTISRIGDEITNENVKADVVHVLDVGAFIKLELEGELRMYRSPEGSSIREGFRSPGFWWAMRLVAIGMAYNSEVLTPEQAPRTWTDLLDPRYQGRLGFKDAATGGSAYAQYYLLRERLGTLFWERMAEQRVGIHRSEQELKEGLIDEGIDVAGQMVGYKILDAKNKGEPIVGVWPEEGVPLIPGPIAILARAPHPEASMLFIDFALSKKGQERFQDLLGAYSSRADVEPLPGQPPLESLQLLTPTTGWDDYLENQRELRAEFEDLFRGGGE